MKAIKLRSKYQLLEVIPKCWQHLPCYEVVKAALRSNEKYDALENAIIDENEMTLTYSVLELSDEEYGLKLESEDNLLLEELKKVVVSLEKGAKIKAIGKKGSENYIACQERLYKRKYEIAKGEIEDFSGLLKNEAQDYALTLEQYKALIIQKYEDGSEVFESFLSMIERARIKAIYFIEQKQNHKTKEIIELMNSVSKEMSFLKIQEIMNLILNFK